MQNECLIRFLDAKQPEDSGVGWGEHELDGVGFSDVLPGIQFVMLGVDRYRGDLLNGRRIRTPPYAGLGTGLHYAPRKKWRGGMFLMRHQVSLASTSITVPRPPWSYRLNQTGHVRIHYAMFTIALPVHRRASLSPPPPPVLAHWISQFLRALECNHFVLAFKPPPC